MRMPQVYVYQVCQQKEAFKGNFLDMHLYNYCLINLILQIIIQNSWQL